MHSPFVAECVANLQKMIETFIISVLILAFCMVLLAIKVLLKKNGTFASQHIHDSEAMRARGIHCVLEQDKEARLQAQNRIK